MNDPFFDVGCLGVFRFATEAERSAFLAAYVGRAPTDEERVRATLGRLLALGFYAAAFQMMSESGRAVPVTRTLPEVLGTFRDGPPAAEIVAAAMADEQARVRAALDHGPQART